MALHDAGGERAQAHDGGRHLFQPGTRRVADSSGKRWLACSQCGRDVRAHPRRSHATGEAPSLLTPRERRKVDPAARYTMQPSRALTIVTRTAAHDDVPAPPRLPTKRDDWQLHLLDHALEVALTAELAPVTRVLLLDAQRAVRSELRPTMARHAPIPVDVPDPQPPPHAIPAKPVPVDQHSAARRKLAAGFRSDKTRALFLRACEAGWMPQVTGTGHAKLTAPTGATLFLSLTNTGGRGFANAKATAKRLGLDVSGL